jgi:branched-chain amino acid transport system ATP-binding protein
MQIADRAVILARGRTVWQGAMTALSPEITQRHVGV